MDSVVATTHTLLFNSIRWTILGKSAVLVLETLMDKPHKRKDLEERLGYSQGGVSGILKKLKDKELVQVHNGVYALADDFEEKIRPYLYMNSKDIEKMKKVHERDREDYNLRLEAWRRAWEDEAAIQGAAAEDQGSIYFMKIVFDYEARYHRVRLNMQDHYHKLLLGLDDHEHQHSERESACAS